MTWEPTWDDLKRIREHLDAQLAERNEEPRDGSPFSNHSEGQPWLDHWCGTCLYDLPARKDDYVNACPLVCEALSGKTPAAWVELDPFSLNQYRCELYRPESEPLPDPSSIHPDQLTIGEES